MCHNFSYDQNNGLASCEKQIYPAASSHIVEERTTGVFHHLRKATYVGQWKHGSLRWLDPFFLGILAENLQPQETASYKWWFPITFYFFSGGTCSRSNEYIEVSLTREMKWWKFATCDLNVRKHPGFPPKVSGYQNEIVTIHFESEVDMGKFRATKQGRRFKPYLVICCGNSRLQIYVPNQFSETKPQMVPIRI